MTLTIDIGNSHTVVGAWQNDALTQTLRLATDVRRTADEWRLLLRAWLDAAPGLASMRRAALCCVVPAVRAALAETLATLGIEQPLWLSAEAKLNFTFAYPQPQTLGADRIADLVAARHYFGDNCIAVDFGTAITFSVLTDGVFQGGVIAPGITSSLDALFTSTAKLPKIAFHKTQRSIGQSTGESIEIGAYLGWRGMVREILSALKSALPNSGERHKIVATGGISESLEFAPDFFDAVDKNLTLKGLYLSLRELRQP